MLYHSCTTHAVALRVMAVAQELPIMSIKVKPFRLKFDIFTAKKKGREMRKGRMTKVVIVIVWVFFLFCTHRRGNDEAGKFLF